MNKVRFLRARGTYTVGQVVPMNDTNKAEIEAAIAAGDAIITTDEAETLRAKNAQLQTSILNGAITRAKGRQAIPSQAGDDHVAIVRARRLAAVDIDTAVDYLDSLAAEKPVTTDITRARQTGSSNVEVVGTALTEHARGFALAKASIPQLMRANRVNDAAEASKIAGLIYRNQLRASLTKEDVLVKDLLRAATTTDANVGYLAGDLVLQETLEFLHNFLPLFSQVTTSFKAEAIEYGQTVIAHYLGVPDVLTYSATTGWGTSKAANAASTPSATGAPVAIDNYKGVEVRFTATQIGGTVRNLFREQVEPSAYALAQAITQAWVALITTANFTGAPLTIALKDFTPAYFATLRDTLDGMGVARMPGARTVVTNTSYENKLLEDSQFINTVTLRNAFAGKGPDTLVTGDLPEIVGIKPIGTQEMTATAANRAGFLFGKSATVIATRLMADWTTIFPDVPATAAVTVATHPDTGLSMMLTRYVDNQLETGNQRLALAYGVAKGQIAAGRVIKSQ